MGYHQAGFEVVGVDIKKQKNYPYEFIQADALEVLKDDNFVSQFDVIAASPPCQTHTALKHLRNAQGRTTNKLDLIADTRELLIKTKKTYVIENVPGSPLRDFVQICGSAFGLKVRRHRWFESNMLELVGSQCDHKWQGKPIGVYGSMNDEIPNGGHTAKTLDEAKLAMGIEHMTWRELVEAIPPAYTRFIGFQLKARL